MKRIILILILPLLFVMCTKKEIPFEQKTDVQKYELQGKVKHLKISEYILEEKFGKMEKTKIFGEYNIYFNENGYITKIDSSYTFKLFAIPVEEFQKKGFDSKNKKIFTYEYNGHNQLISVKSSDYEERYSYDQKGNATEINVIKNNSSENRKILRDFNDEGFLVESNEYNANGILVKGYTCKYNNKGLILEKEYYTAIYTNGVKQPSDSKMVYEYSRGNVEESFWQKYSDYVNLKNGTQIDKIITKQNKYNSKKELVYSYIRDAWEGEETGDHYNYTYEKHDDKGNWLKRKAVHTSKLPNIEGVSNQPLELTERIIEYY